MPRSISLLVSKLLPILAFAFVALPLAACDSDGSDSGPDPSGNRGEGTLVLDGVTYDFDVIACDFSGEADDTHQTVTGRGTTPEGEDFNLFVSRNDIGGLLAHTISFQMGDVASGGGTVIEAQRMRMNGTWNSLHDEPNEPLIQISGNTLTASGVFSVNDDLDDTMHGELTATCN